MTEPLVAAQDVTVGWGRREVLRGVTMSVRRGDYVALVGPNGSGKSTLVRCLLGLARPLAGVVVRGPGWRAGHVPQRDALAPLFRVRAEEVVSMAAEPAAWLPGTRLRARRAAARGALEAVGMAELAGRVFRDLSGGQRQRVLIARALASEPAVLVLDEPTTGMDLAAEADLLALIRRLRAERGLAILLVTHSLHVAADEAEEVGLLHGGAVRFGPPDEVLSKASLSEVYGRPVTVDRFEGRRVIRLAEPR